MKGLFLCRFRYYFHLFGYKYTQVFTIVIYYQQTSSLFLIFSRPNYSDANGVCVCVRDEKMIHIGHKPSTHMEIIVKDVNVVIVCGFTVFICTIYKLFLVLLF